mmetsp:Transcript_55205/g.124343  ORF Transcript_55205/g.124343 Transcript_55205/m.124343 type:complete len:262 (-) Transcript_55205:61-846(-)
MARTAGREGRSGAGARVEGVPRGGTGLCSWVSSVGVRYQSLPLLAPVPLDGARQLFLLGPQDGSHVAALALELLDKLERLLRVLGGHPHLLADNLLEPESGGLARTQSPHLRVGHVAKLAVLLVYAAHFGAQEDARLALSLLVSGRTRRGQELRRAACGPGAVQRRRAGVPLEQSGYARGLGALNGGLPLEPHGTGAVHLLHLRGHVGRDIRRQVRVSVATLRLLGDAAAASVLGTRGHPLDSAPDHMLPVSVPARGHPSP